MLKSSKFSIVIKVNKGMKRQMIQLIEYIQIELLRKEECNQIKSLLPTELVIVKDKFPCQFQS